MLIPEAIRNRVLAAETLVVVPHHVLHYFPFAALVTERDSEQVNGFQTVMPKFLIEQGLSLIYAPSLASWSYLRSHSLGMRSAAAMGVAEFADAPPLPGVERDLANLRTHLGDRLRTLVDGPQATELELRRLLQQPGLLFAATHGMNYADAPMSSFLLCHPSQDVDGQLTAEEIFLQPVAADVVVLSACFSGLADRSPLPGDDLFGLQRALLASGARSVVSGQWDVYDGTGPLLMEPFFAELSRGIPVASSLAKAQRGFLQARRQGGRRELWIHPYFWSVYTCAGSDVERFTGTP